MHQIQSVVAIAALGMSISLPAEAGGWGPPTSDYASCEKKAVGNGLLDDLAKLLAVMNNRCTNAGGGNGGELSKPSGGYSVGTPTEANDADPGSSGAKNQAGKKN